MKRQKLIIALVGILLITLIAWVAIYLQNIYGVFAPDLSEWGSFGDFFWGLGTMLLTGLNVYVFYKLTTIIAKQEKNHQEAYLNFEMLKVKLQKQKELIDDFCRAELFTFAFVDDENGVCALDTKRIENAMELFSGLNDYGDILTTINDEQYQNTYRRFCNMYYAYKSQDEENELVENWEENLYALRRSLNNLEKRLKREHIDTLLRALQNEQ